ncbi:unnamed protein product [Rotaria magnacalcarata]|uniref:Uncharacterized protein n=1 Tax=Rotaria magnacalcarata TaxID=392030 RepID=A0A815WNS2_9BILA|nr:unnamed protein product [Rotaria magnacalcarata]
MWKLIRRQHPLTTGAVFISWFFSILFVFLLPLDNSSATIIAASTTWGLFLLVLMLGYGPVQVPLDVYRHSRTSYMLSHIQFKLSKRYS